MRSASPVIVALAALVLSGCVNTQRRNERYKLRADRTLASRRPVRVTTPTADVAVGPATVLRASRRSAVVVELTNRTGRVLSDLPIAVRVGGRRLNAHGGLPFFHTHVAAIGPHARVAWVLTTRGRIPRGRASVLVGAPARLPSGLPSITAHASTVRNTTDVPQYGLPVYALVRRGGRYVAAGTATVPDLGSRASARVHLSLVGDRRGGPIVLEALPTIFR